MFSGIQALSLSFAAVPNLLHFVNDSPKCQIIEKVFRVVSVLC